ncbi:regulator of chromosome condensation 1/beta-lactamase-inhibitor protein II [Mariannaea sp. PMI_226]|nr:regulator of chromosome condensation 1/beta-lactamase-inhibitor protein II [Mariannaea sp. PMI_226]
MLLPTTRRGELPLRAKREAMELYATGFNAWNQLIFEPTTTDHDSDGDDSEPLDIYSYTKVLGAQEISPPEAHLAFTVVYRDGTPWVAGSSAKKCAPLDNDPRGNLNSLHAISADGTVLAIQETTSGDDVTQTLVGYPSVTDWKLDNDRRQWPLTSPVRQIAAYRIGFVLLHEDQDSPVSTLGEARFQDCLGRDVDDSNPIDQPCPVSSLSDLGDPIKKVTANGYNLAALTEGGAVYMWGTQVAGGPDLYYPFPEIEGIPNYIEVDGEKDIMDVALGDNHGIALTTDGCVYVIGDNTNGQLGLGTDFTGVAESWTKVDFKAPPGWEILGVEAGPKSSFILTAKIPQH